MLSTKCIGIFSHVLERCDERICISVSYLKAYAYEHREDEEYRHLLLFEQLERVKTEYPYE
jgi:hypothetical protein